MAEQQYSGIGGYFNSFLTPYRTPEKRFAAAQKLLEGEIDAGIGTHFSRMQLIARWGHSNDELFPLSERMYSLKSKLGEKTGQLALSFVRGSLVDVVEAEGGMDGFVAIEVGTIAGDLVHGVGRHRGGRTSDRPPLMRHNMGIPVQNVTRIVADVIDEPTVTNVGDEAVLPVWEGVSALANDMTVYRAEASMTEHDVIVGTAHCLSIIRQIDDLTSQNGQLDRHLRQLVPAA